MAEFQVPVREGKEDFGSAVRVEIAELDERPEVAIVFSHPQHGAHEFLHWEGRLLRPFPGLRGAPVDVGTLSSLLALGQTTDPFSRDHWKSPFEPSRFTQDRRGTNPLARKGLSRQAKQSIREGEIADASEGLAFVRGVLHYAVEEPVLNLAFNRLQPDGAVTLVPDFGDNGIVDASWASFRPDRMDDAVACAEAFAEGTGRRTVPMEGSLDLLMPEVLRRNDVESVVREGLRSFLMFVKDFPKLRTPESLALSKKASAFLGKGPDLASPEVADSAFVLIADAVDNMRAMDASSSGGMGGVSAKVLHGAILENLVYSCVRYSSYDRDWLESQQSPSGPRPR